MTDATPLRRCPIREGGPSLVPSASFLCHRRTRRHHADQQATEKVQTVGAAAEHRQRLNGMPGPQRSSDLLITRSLVKARLQLADQEPSQRLWQEVADRDLEVGRIIHLMYGCWFHGDNEAMTKPDDQFLSMSVLQIPDTNSPCVSARTTG